MLIARPMNMKTPSVVAMVLLLNTSRDNNGCGALYVHVSAEGRDGRARSYRFAKEKGTVTTGSCAHSQITRPVFINIWKWGAVESMAGPFLFQQRFFF